jgi:Fic family protein
MKQQAKTASPRLPGIYRAISQLRRSQDTALRDIEDFVKKGVLVKDRAGGRSTSYSLAKVA